jgi:hypothetical protein
MKKIAIFDLMSREKAIVSGGTCMHIDGNCVCSSKTNDFSILSEGLSVGDCKMMEKELNQRDTTSCITYNSSLFVTSIIVSSISFAMSSISLAYICNMRVHGKKN